MSLTAQQRKLLKAKAHHLTPVVTIGNKGLTDTVIKEIDGALTAHELIKAKDYASEREERQTLAEYACLKTESDLVAVIGKTLILYRKSAISEKKPAPKKNNFRKKTISGKNNARKEAASEKISFRKKSTSDKYTFRKRATSEKQR